MVRDTRLQEGRISPRSRLALRLSLDFADFVGAAHGASPSGFIRVAPLRRTPFSRRPACAVAQKLDRDLTTDQWVGVRISSARQFQIVFLELSEIPVLFEALGHFYRRSRRLWRLGSGSNGLKTDRCRG